ncbi:MAG TPA: zinc-binding alcohol dehydrogenase family protein [Gemmataceae bacterium]|jgi:alcohol dehydrogenase|nr:zinc-binding alcohol dehydrogenase family protein [Gemmataceae bacterium]
MKAILLREPGKLEQVHIAETARPGPGEALVRVHRVGICGTDISGYLGKMPFYSYPRIPGHELGVEVVAVGDDVNNLRPGERCSVEPYLNCQQCYACRRGNSNCCESLQVLGVHTDGGLRPQFLLPARKLHKSGKLSLDQLALVETLGIGCHAVSRGRPAAGDHVLVIGAGPIGLSVIEFLKLAGAVITVMDMNGKRRDFCAKTLGVPHTILFREDDSELPQIRAITDGALFSVVFDATGNTRSMCNAAHYVAHSGRLVLVGVVTDSISFPDPLLHRRELSIHASRNALPADFERIIQLIEDGRLDTRPWITHRSAFADLIGDFPSYTRPETGVIKAMVDVE